MAVICEDRQKETYSSHNQQLFGKWAGLFSGQSQSSILPCGNLSPRQHAITTALALLTSLNVWRQSRACLSRLFLVLYLTTMAPRLQKLGLTFTTKKGGRANHRRKSQPPPQFHSEEVHSKPGDDHPGLHDVIQKLGALITALATTNARVDKLTKQRAPQAIIPAKHPGSRCLSAVGNPPCCPSAAEPDQGSIEDQIRLWVEHCRRVSY